MVTDLRYYSGKDINLRNSQPFIAILVIVMIFGLISHNPAEIIFIILMAYALSGYVMFFRNRYIRNMRKKDA
jgi:CDP-diacylglycerol--serine O-phosphatidyltransferase